MQIDLGRDAYKFLKNLDPKQFKQICMKIWDLAGNPYPNDSIALKNSPEGYRRASIGEYRIVYRVDEEIVRIDYIDKRNDDAVYKRLK
jgi:mRNA interferase RelE/StbE